MRTFGLWLVILAGLSLLLSLGYAAMPFRVPLTSEDALHAAMVLGLAGVIAVVGGRGTR